MISRFHRPTVLLCTAVLMLAGCDLGPDYHRPSLDIPEAYRATPQSAAAAWPSADWWRGFNSPELNALIEQARAQNFDIAAAIARVRQADAQVRIAGALLLPDFSGTGNASWQHEGLGTGSSTRIEPRSSHSACLSISSLTRSTLSFWMSRRRSAISGS